MKVRLYLKSQPPMTFEGNEIRILKRDRDYDLQVNQENVITYSIDDFCSLIWDEKYFPELRSKDSL